MKNMSEMPELAYPGLGYKQSERRFNFTDRGTPTAINVYKGGKVGKQ